MALSAFETPTPVAMRSAMGRLTAGVCVVSTVDESGDFHGMTISSMTSISLEPAILLISLTHGSRTTEAVSHSGLFAVSILGKRQEAVARRFASRGGARFEGIDCDSGVAGLPFVKSAVAQLDCRVMTIHDVGDHRVFYGSVTSLRYRDGSGLGFCAGRFGSLDDFGHDEVPWLF